MKTYKEVITLNKNNRGCYILDTVKGCSGGLANNSKGCYSDCYAKRIADRYGFNFGKSIDRSFYNKDNQFFLFGFSDRSHTDEIIRKVKAIDMPFVRIGEMGDPSENWEHTIGICNEIFKSGKPIVIITKHWKRIPDSFLGTVKRLNLCINTSISALDTETEIKHRLREFYRLKKVCNSVLRIVSCEFNKENPDGLERSILQDESFKHHPNIDTVFRPSKNNPFVLKDIINVQKVRFLNKDVMASVFNDNTYLGECKDCPDMCGI